MEGPLLVYIASFVVAAWGIAHIIPTHSVVAGFGPLTETNRRIITMEWVAEGGTLCFIGVVALLTVLFGGAGAPFSLLVYRTLAGMLLLMAVWTQLTGARTPIIPIKICPVVKTIAAVLFILGSIL